MDALRCVCMCIATDQPAATVDFPFRKQPMAARLHWFVRRFLGAIMKLSKIQKDGINLLIRSKDIGDGWRQCAPNIFRLLADAMSAELVERNEELQRMRLTQAGEAVAKWAC